MPSVLRKEPIDMFVHDSEHTYDNMRREFATVWDYLRPGGAVVADDVGGNPAFDELMLKKDVALAIVIGEIAKSHSKFGVVLKSAS